ncbi:glycosyltransferase [Mycobacterium sp. 1081908.1]|uniref:glycosyltransferase n=1 Tax=Mycobacterium sp. 1081908.1 TaxID=1834066 RepID=UPI0007FD03A3|nr:nucleotide disphospho-sugar-binding domain-containing protein [Mycobacterium sp. 1081908.1]OBK48828.1 UDP-glucuronosyltransferase [Mycobacterium sp. 1081908.1]
MRILFVTVDGGGNIPPQLAIARALKHRGAQVSFLGHEGVREQVEAAGFAFEPFRAGHHFDPTVRRSLLALMADFAKTSMDRQLGRCAVDVAQRQGASAIVVDVILTAGISEVLKADIPTVVCVHCFYRGMQDLAASPIGWLLRLRGTPPLGAERSDALHIVTARADLDPVRGAPPVHHTGVAWQGVPKAAAAQPIPRILISLSTCAFAGQRRMLQNILEAIGPLPVQATVTVGPAIDAAGLRVPGNASLHAWLDHDEVLAGASLVVGHGGHSTTMRALSFGVPVIVMPANVLIDQRRVGAAVRDAGAGLLLRKHAAPNRIRAAIETVLLDPRYRQSAARLGERIRERDGAQQAAELITQFACAKREPKPIGGGDSRRACAS